MPPDSPTAVLPSNDARPNSGLREGDISHADVNTAIRGAAKTIIFGQQNRLRNGILMGDEKLPRFHAGHELVRFFYQGMNKLPEYLLDALLDSEISITLVTGPAATASDARAAEKARAAGGDLLVFDHFRQHQSFHIGYTRRTIYIPEGILREAVYKGWDSWAIAEAVIREACPLLDYRLLLNFILRSQQRLRSHFTIGSQTVIKNAFLRMNKHLVVSENEENEESEFEAFLRYYGQKFFKFDRNILDQDSYELADSIFDEPQEREWSNQKVNQISTTYDFPDFFDLDRDIVHPAAHRAAETVGQSTEPETVDDIIHDMADAARFRHLRQTRTNALIDQLLAKGGPGIQAFADAAGNERATGDLTICANHHDNYDTVIVFKEKLQALSNTGPEGSPGSICNDFRNYLQRRTVRKTREHHDRFMELPAKQQREHLKFFRRMVSRAVGWANFTNPDDQAMLAANVARARDVATLSQFMQSLLMKDDAEVERQQMLNVLRKLERHAGYHAIITDQIAELMGVGSFSLGENIRDQVKSLYEMVPEKPYLLSSDPQGIVRRKLEFEDLSRRDPDNAHLFNLLVGMLIRLDKAENFDRITACIAGLGDRATPELQGVIDALNPNDTKRVDILCAARDLLTVTALSA